LVEGDNGENGEEGEGKKIDGIARTLRKIDAVYTRLVDAM